MAAIELTRMDFHVTRFVESEEVEEMGACEVGQYCLLLFKAWSRAKEVTLPVDEAKLAKYARVENVSPLVLRQFPVVETEWGSRRRNDVQYRIWTEAVSRSNKGKDMAKSRWNKKNDTEGDD